MCTNCKIADHDLIFNYKTQIAYRHGRRSQPGTCTRQHQLPA